MSHVTVPGGRVDVTKVRALLRENDLTSWDDVWKAKVIPWEGGYSQPPLKEVIESGEVDFPRQGRALVPGCGSGYDAILFASTLGLDAVGMDISETAIEVANRNLAALEAPLKGSVKFIIGDFFTLDLSEVEKVDLIYDCAFFVAVPPSYRPAWSRQMANLIKPGGYLITLIFPMDPLSDIGPPWSVRPSHYHEHLDSSFAKVIDRKSDVSLPGRAGRERIAVWKRL